MKVMLVLLLGILILGLGIPLARSQGEEDTASVDTAKIMRKLDKVLDNQAEIAKQLSALQQELAVVKVRCSR